MATRPPADRMDEEEAARHLARAVRVWPLSGERHLEVTGPGADALMQQTTPRDLARIPEGRRAYLPVCGPSGRMMGDPMAHRVAGDVWRLSGRADLGPWLRTLARASRMAVLARPLELRTLAVQGPLAEALVARVLGPEAAALGPMGWGRTRFGRIGLTVARSDVTRAGGFELVVEGRVEPLRRALLDAGADLDARAGAPGELVRIEGGLVLWEVDLGPDLTPFEAGLGRLCDGGHDHVARAALEEAGSADRIMRPVEIEGPALPRPEAPWPVTGGGRVTSAAWSAERGVQIAIGLVGAGLVHGAAVGVETPHGRRTGCVRHGFWS